MWDRQQHGPVPRVGARISKPHPIGALSTAGKSVWASLVVQWSHALPPPLQDQALSARGSGLAAPSCTEDEGGEGHIAARTSTRGAPGSASGTLIQIQLPPGSLASGSQAPIVLPVRLLPGMTEVGVSGPASHPPPVATPGRPPPIDSCDWLTKVPPHPRGSSALCRTAAPGCSRASPSPRRPAWSHHSQKAPRAPPAPTAAAAPPALSWEAAPAACLPAASSRSHPSLWTRPRGVWQPPPGGPSLRCGLSWVLRSSLHSQALPWGLASLHRPQAAPSGRNSRPARALWQRCRLEAARLRWRLLTCPTLLAAAGGHAVGEGQWCGMTMRPSTPHSRQTGRAGPRAPQRARMQAAPAPATPCEPAGSWRARVGRWRLPTRCSSCGSSGRRWRSSGGCWRRSGRWEGGLEERKLPAAACQCCLVEKGGWGRKKESCLAMPMPASHASSRWLQTAPAHTGGSCCCGGQWAGAWSRQRQPQCL